MEEPDLPIETIREGFRDAHRRGHVVVVAPTGSGKSTRVPLWAAEEEGPVLVVEPRRVACRSLARYVSARLGEPLGRAVGYMVRYEDRTGEATRVVYATPGVALRLFAEARLGRFGTIVLDEFHERGVQSDLLLALLRAAGRERLVVMSATIAGERVAGALGAALLVAEGKVFPVEVRYAGEDELPSGRGLADRVARAVADALRLPGDILVFLPGKGEIADCAARLRAVRGIEVVPLHGDLPPREQDRAFDPGGRRRVILATNVAETSVTLPRIGVVLDAGLVRRTELRRGRSTLSLVPIAGDSAEQRRGRAGRLGPGVAIRLWGRRTRLEPRTPPEILREELADAALAAAACGATLGDLPFLDPPRPGAVEAAEADLRAMGALDAAGRITDVGRAMAGLPVDAFQARLLVEAVRAGDEGLLQDMVDLVATLGSGRPLWLPAEDAATREARDPLLRDRCDATARILALRRGDVRRHGLHPATLQEARRAARQLRSLLDLPGAEGRGVDRDRLIRAIVAADPATAFVARRRGKGYGNGEIEVLLSRASLVRPGTEAIVVVQSQAISAKGRRTRIQASCAIPTTFRRLAALGLGESRLGRVRLDGDRFVGRIERVYAGRTIERREAVLEGAMAREACAALLEGGALGEAIASARDAIDAWNLAARLFPASGRRPVDPRAWLLERLGAIGFEGAADLPLLDPSDFRFDGLSAEERADLDARFPRRLALSDARCDVEYDPASRTVYVIRRAGAAKVPPSPAFLPPWPGWRVVWRDRGRERVLRSG